MKEVVLFFLLTVSSVAASAQPLCKRNRADYGYILDEVRNRISFKNDGGLLNGGVCWWHSRLQRSSLYLATFDPSLPKPNAVQVRRILSDLRTMRQVVSIPGFADFNSFTQHFQTEVQKVLNSWQREDGFINLEWRRGISGRSQLPQNELAKKMAQLYAFQENSPVPVWIMAQVKGIVSHSFLIRQMELVGQGFDLKVIDSNAPLVTREIHYRFGDHSLKLIDADYTFIPYVGFQDDFRKIAKALRTHCQQKGGELLHLLENVMPGEIEAKPREVF